MVKIAIADDQVLFRDMLGIILSQEPLFEVVGNAGDGNDIIHLCSEREPDIVLMDIKMPKADGIYGLLRIKENFPGIKVIMLTTFEEEEYIFKACANAADGYILKDAKPEALINAVKCVSDGFFVIHKSVQKYIESQLGKVAESGEKSEALDDVFDFDSVDLTILKLLSMGKNNAQIAQSINYSEGTVKNRISHMLEMTGFKDRTQLAIFALQNNII